MPEKSRSHRTSFRGEDHIWLKGENQLPKIVQGVTFHNGIEVTNTPAQNAA